MIKIKRIRVGVCKCMVAPFKVTHAVLFSLASGPGNWHKMSVKKEGEREISGLSEKEIQRDGGRDRHILLPHSRYSTINCYLELRTHIQTCSFACSVTNKRVFIAGRTLLQQCHLSTANKDSTPVAVRLHSSGILNHRITLISNAWPEMAIYLEYWIRTSKNWNTDWDCH